MQTLKPLGHRNGTIKHSKGMEEGILAIPDSLKCDAVVDGFAVAVVEVVVAAVVASASAVCVAFVELKR